MTEVRDTNRWDERSWAIWLIAERQRSRIVAAQGRKFAAIPSDRVSELFDAVQERACAPRGPNGEFPAGAYKHADLEFVAGFLSEALFNALREYKRRRFDRTVADGEAVLAAIGDGPADLADLVHTRQALDVIAEHAGELADDVKAYMWADFAGVKRAEILADSGWTVRKLRAVRREVDEFRARARVAVAVFLPLPLLHRWLKLGGTAKVGGAAGSGGGAKVLLACGAAATTAACGLGAVVLADAPDRGRAIGATIRAAAPTPVPTVQATPVARATPAPERPSRPASATAAPTARAPRAPGAASPGPTPPPASATRVRIAPARPPATREASSDDFNSEFAP